MPLILKTVPAELPVSVTEINDHLRIAETESLIADFIKAATMHVENLTWRSLVEQTWELQLCGFPSGNGAILLPKPPLIAVDSVIYFAADNQSATLQVNDYIVTNGEPAELRTAASWPVTADRFDAVTVIFRAGYGTADDVPAPIKHALKLIIGNMYCDREITNATPNSIVDVLLANYKFRDNKILEFVR